ncbi:hypothetical protein EDB92DRAFT_208111 [Lactarius akahatsu]|uniref:DUF6534 domain-containing protein n=1 Tax=Lactarius akahatsu TaxID=416441 RepID=A0AAD4QFR0_9AGAM|nr:hypothetical protein EDB92DRAFT_208111 [Lactarius akahatsu]
MAGSSESPSASPDVIKAASPLLFGPLFNWTLYGILCVQIYVYSYNFPMDGRSVKVLAYFVFVLETVQTALTGADMYYWFIADFGNVERLAHSHFAPIDIAIINAIISLVVQGYFCYRIWVLSKRDMVGRHIAQGREVCAFQDRSIFMVDTECPLGHSDRGGDDALRKACSDFSNFVLIRVVRLTVETNALTAAMAITALVLYAAFPNEVYYVYITVIIGKIYSNTLLASLNNRIYFRDRRSSVHGISAALPVSKRVRAATITSPGSAIPEPQLQDSKGDIFPLYSISRPGNLDDDTSTDWSPSHPRKIHTLPEDPEWMAGMPPHPYGRKDEMPVL